MYDRLDEILEHYSLSCTNAKEMDTSRTNDFRLNIVLDKKYVLRINQASNITESRVSQMDRLSARYNEFGLLAPRFIKNKHDLYSIHFDDKIAYVSEYIDIPLANELKLDDDAISIMSISHLGKFATRYTGVDLIETRSM